mmetsp:Transcript_65646/g.173862  ORF Transcript_65646/g.173862 Transcript_65646/m.173862 type:complete len:233 (+) Transcript_65646:616-1314(+)
MFSSTPHPLACKPDEAVCERITATTCSATPLWMAVSATLRSKVKLHRASRAGKRSRSPEPACIARTSCRTETTPGTLRLHSAAWSAISTHSRWQISASCRAEDNMDDAASASKGFASRPSGERSSHRPSATSASVWVFIVALPLSTERTVLTTTSCTPTSRPTSWKRALKRSSGSVGSLLATSGTHVLWSSSMVVSRRRSIRDVLSSAVTRRGSAAHLSAFDRADATLTSLS